MVAVLTGIFGVENLMLAEDVVQEALLRALQVWPYQGVPENPAGWLMRTARNRAIDAVRRTQNFQAKEPEIIRQIEDRLPVAAEIPDPGALADDRLRLMFVCCDPRLPAEAQTALALKTLCGFGGGEIARAFLTTEAAVAKRLTRARQQIAAEKIPFAIPAGDDLQARLGGVWHTLYLLFNEGYKATQGDQLLRQDISDEAIRLTQLLAGHPAGDRPETHALLALMWLNCARFPARMDAAGNLIRLADQDRRRWDQAMIGQGMAQLMRASTGMELSSYHLEAGIAACHCAARDYASTDWAHIVALYDRLLRLKPTPVVGLNRAVAVGEGQGPAAGLAALAALKDHTALENYYLYYAVRGELERRADQLAAAAQSFNRALELVQVASEKAFIARQLMACTVALAERAK